MEIPIDYSKEESAIILFNETSGSVIRVVLEDSIVKFKLDGYLVGEYDTELSRNTTIDISKNNLPKLIGFLQKVNENL